MRLAATLMVRDDITPGDGTPAGASIGAREADRQPVALRGTLRGYDAAPRDVVILDISTSGFLAELPIGTALADGTRVRVAAAPFGAQEAVVVRQDERCHGFVFARPLDPATLDGVDGEQPSSIALFPGAPLPVPIVPDKAISARASLALMVAISLGLWLALAGVVAALTLLA